MATKHEQDVAKMRARLDELEAENTALKAKGNGALTFTLKKKGEKLRNGELRSADVLVVSGGAIGYPVGHSEDKWLRILGCAKEIEEHIAG